MAGHLSGFRGASHRSGVAYSGYPSRLAAHSSEPGLCSSSVTAYSVEFVAKPSEVQKAQSALAPAIAGTLKEVTGFAGCMLMSSDQEARLMTVVTFWRGADRLKHCNANTRWVNALLAPYMDRRLRVQTMMAQLPAVSFLENETSGSSEVASKDANVECADEVCVV
jgi:hypothetical protein